jgi:hypothetical protein
MTGAEFSSTSVCMLSGCVKSTKPPNSYFWEIEIAANALNRHYTRRVVVVMVGHDVEDGMEVAYTAGVRLNHIGDQVTRSSGSREQKTSVLARRRSNEARTLPLKHSEGINSDHGGNDC